MNAVAILRNSPIAPRKMRLIVNTIRGKRVGEALQLLKFERKAGAPAIQKLLLSAISNWKNAHDQQGEVEELFVSEVFVTDGKTIKRFRPAPQGRAYRIRKRSNHVTLVVSKFEQAPDLQTEVNNESTQSIDLTQEQTN
jgi:large subunit ribosomal protein L22